MRQKKAQNARNSKDRNKDSILKEKSTEPKIYKPQSRSETLRYLDECIASKQEQENQRQFEDVLKHEINSLKEEN